MLLRMEDHLSQEVSDLPEWPAEHVVRGLRAVDTLLDLKSIRCLGPFLRGPRTLSQAAVELDMSTSTLAYRIKKLEDAGLITRVSPRERAGMAMPRYRASGQLLFLPFSEVPAGMTSDVLDGGRKRLLDRFLDGLDEVLQHAGHSGLQFTASGESGVEVDLREPADIRTLPPWTDFWGSIHMTKEQAYEFAEELKQLVERYRDLPATRGEYIVHIGLAPSPKRRTRSA